MTAVRRLVDLWWIRLPVLTRRVSLVGSSALTDGYAAVSVPWFAAVATPAAFVGGFIAGRDSLGYDFIFTQSLALMLVFLAIGSISAHYGLVFLAGFVIGDFFFHLGAWENPAPWLFRSDGWWDHAIHFRIPLLILYLALFLLTVNLPLAAKTATAQFAFGPRPVRFVVAMAVHAVVSGGFAYLWSQSIPVILRPIFTWTGGTPHLSTVEPAQTNGSAFIVVAVVCSLARLIVQVGLASSTVTRIRQDLWADSIESTPSGPSIYERLPRIVRAAVGAGLVTLMMAGLFLTWTEAWVILGIAFAVALLRTGAIPVPLGGFRRLMARVPLPIRIGLGMFIVWRVAQSEIGGDPVSSPDFQPALVVVGISMIVFFLLIPGSRREDER